MKPRNDVMRIQEGYTMKKVIFFYSIIFLTSDTYAAILTNNIEGLGPESFKPPVYVCVQNSSGTVTLPLSPNQSGDANQASGNIYYAGGSIRFNGCSTDNDYLGYLGISIGDKNPQPSIASYSPPQGVHIAYENQKIDTSGHLTGNIAYTPIQPNFALSSPSGTLKNWSFVGVNLSGLEFGKLISPFVIPNLSKEDANATTSDLNETQGFIHAGMNTIRVPLSWSYLQWDGPEQPSINKAYYDNYVKPLLETLTSAKIYTIVDLHAYMRYSTYGQQYSGCGQEGPCPDGTLVLDMNAYRSVWGQLWELMRQDPKINTAYLMLDLMNEPVDVPDDSVFTIQAELIKMLRGNHFNGYILVEGNAWSGLHSWITHSWTSSTGDQYSNATLFSRKNFNHAGITDLSKILINVHQYLDSDYSGTHQDCLQNLKTTGVDGFNLDAFIKYLKENQLQAMVTEFGVGQNAASCTPALTQFMDYLKSNASGSNNYGFVGWTIWSSGHGWGNYNLRVQPNDYRMGVLKNYL